MDVYLSLSKFVSSLLTEVRPTAIRHIVVLRIVSRPSATSIPYRLLKSVSGLYSRSKIRFVRGESVPEFRDLVTVGETPRN